MHLDLRAAEAAAATAMPWLVAAKVPLRSEPDELPTAPASARTSWGRTRVVSRQALEPAPAPVATRALPVAGSRALPVAGSRALLE
jgi:hypothetical protein